MKRRVVAASLLVLLAAACGREGGPWALPQKARFCKLANKLSDEAVVALVSVGAGTPLSQRAKLLESFINAHRSVYAELDRNAPVGIRPALLRQRAAQRAFFAATTDAEQKAAYAAVVGNGNEVRDYEVRNCPGR